MCGPGSPAGLPGKERVNSKKQGVTVRQSSTVSTVSLKKIP